MAALPVIGKVSIKVWPDTSGFNEALAKERFNDIKVNVKVDQDAFRKSLQDAVGHAKDEHASGEPVSIPARIELADDEPTVSPKVDSKSVADELHEALDKAGRRAGRDMGHTVGDLVGDGVADHVQRALSDGLDLEPTLRPRLDLGDANRALDRLRARLRGAFKLKVEADYSQLDSVLRAVDRFESKIAGRSLSLRVDLELDPGAGAKLTAQALAAIKVAQAALPPLKVQLDGAQQAPRVPKEKRPDPWAGYDFSLGGYARRLRQQVRAAYEKALPSNAEAGRQVAKMWREGWSHAARDLKIDAPLQALRASVGRAQLFTKQHVGGSLAKAAKAASGPAGKLFSRWGSQLGQQVKMGLGRGVRGLGAGLGQSVLRMSGMRLGHRYMMNTFRQLADFDLMMPKLLVGAGAANQLAASFGSLASNVLTLGRGMAQMAPAALALPGLFASGTVAALSLVFGLKTLNEELPEVAEAFSAIDSQANAGFWETAKRSGADLVGIATALGDGFRVSGRAAGGWFASLAESLNRVVSPALPAMFQGVADGFAALAAGSDGIAISLREFGLLGAAYFPRFNQWIADGANRFGDWLARARESGKSLEWIETGLQRIREFGSVLAGTGGMLARLSAIAERAGGASLRGLADALARINAALDSPRVSGTIESLLKAAHGTTGAFFSGLSEGLGKFLEMAGSIANVVGPNIGGALGSVVGSFLGGLSSPAVASALTAFSENIANLGRALSPVLRQAGETVGLMTAINAAIEPIGSVAATAVGAVLAAVDKLGPSLAKAITSLGGAKDLVEGAVEPLYEAVVALGPFIEGLGDTLGRFASRITQPLKKGLSGVRPLIEGLGAGLLAVLDTASEALAQFGESALPALGQALESLGGALKGIGEGIAGVLDWDNRLGLFDWIGKGAAFALNALGMALGLVEMLGTALGHLMTGNWEELFKFDMSNLKPILDPALSAIAIFDEKTANMGRAYLFGEEAAAGMAEAQLDVNRGFDATIQRGVEAGEKIQGAFDQALVTMRKFSAEGIEKTLQGATDTIRKSAAGIDLYWTNAFGAEKAQANGDKLMSLLKEADAAMRSAGISAEEFGNLNSEAWQKAVSAGTERGQKLREAYDDLRGGFKELGLTASELEAMLAMPGLDENMRAQLAGALELAKQFEQDTSELEGAEIELRLKALMDEKSAADAQRAMLRLFNPNASTADLDMVFNLRPLVKGMSAAELDAVVAQAVQTTGLSEQEVRVMLGLEGTVAPGSIASLEDAMRVTIAQANAGLSPIEVKTKIKPAPAGDFQALQAKLNQEASARKLQVNIPFALTGKRPGLPDTGAAGVGVKVTADTSKATASLDTFGARVRGLASQLSVGVSGTVSFETRDATAAADALGRSVSGMSREVSSGGSSAVRAAQNAASGISGAFRGISLAGAGASIMSSLIAGIDRKRATLIGTLQAVTRLIPKFKGPKHVDQRLLTQNGQWIMQSLADGFDLGARRFVVPSLKELTRDLAGYQPPGFEPVVNARAAYRAAVDPSDVLGGDGGERVAVNVNVNNPVAERSSDTVRRSLELATAIF